MGYFIVVVLLLCEFRNGSPLICLRTPPAEAVARFTTVVFNWLVRAGYPEHLGRVGTRQHKYITCLHHIFQCLKARSHFIDVS
jgi:hypothetical protein